MGQLISCITSQEVKAIKEGDRVFFKTFYGNYICVLDTNNVTQVSDLQDGCFFIVKAFNPSKIAFKTYYGDTYLSAAADGSIVQNNTVTDTECFAPVYVDGKTTLKSVSLNTFVIANENLSLSHTVQYNERTMLSIKTKYFN